MWEFGHARVLLIKMRRSMAAKAEVDDYSASCL